MQLTTHQYSKKIRDHRQELGLTQNAAALILGMTERNYHGYENGRKNIRHWEYLGIIAALTEGNM